MSERVSDDRIAKLTTVKRCVHLNAESAAELRALAREIQERRAADLTLDDLRSIADTVEELRANAQNWDPGESSEAIAPLEKILARGVTTRTP